MNRWRQRLAELHGEGADQQPAPLPRAVQNVRNVQNPPADLPSEHFEHFEHFEQLAEPPAAEDRAAAVWSEAQDERAAIVEHDGNIPREWAEGLTRLDPDRPPGDVPPRRWHRFVDDVGQFLDSPFCAVAAALGWTAFDLFGADRDRPFARLDQCGLMWLLNGDRLVMLAEDAATIKTRTGARHTYRRKPSGFGSSLAWELAP